MADAPAGHPVSILRVCHVHCLQQTGTSLEGYTRGFTRGNKICSVECSNRMTAQEMDGGKEVAEVASVRPNRNVRLVSVESITEVGKMF